MEAIALSDAGSFQERIESLQVMVTLEMLVLNCTSEGTSYFLPKWCSLYILKTFYQIWKPLNLQ